MLNGEGIRVVLWVSGCTRHCKNCQNPQTWDFNSGIPFDKAAFEELCKALDKPYISGLTLSGGNPLEEQHSEEVYELVKNIKEMFPDKDIWIYSGLTFDEALGKYKKILEKCDVMVDGAYIEELRDVKLPYRGSSNQRIIDLRESFDRQVTTLWENEYGN